MFTNKSFNLLSFLVFSFCLYFLSFELDSNQNINSDETEIISDESQMAFAPEFPRDLRV